MVDEQVQVELLNKSGYSDRAINYFINKVNVGEIESPSASFPYTGPCGDTMQVQLKIDNGRITEARFQAIGCAGSYSAGSALMKMIKGKTLEQAEEISEEQILDHLGNIPPQKIHCVCLAKRTLAQTIKQYKRARGEG